MNEKNDNLKSYVCLNPFNYLEIHQEKVYCCCPSWLKLPVGDVENLSDIWHGENLKKIQESVLDGSYLYCNKELCPRLSELYYNNISTYFMEKKYFISANYNDGPEMLNLSFDRTCNLSCPSCRDQVESYELDNNIMDNISNSFGNSVIKIGITGSGDAFASKIFRNFLINFDYEKFPKTSSIHLQTNGLLLTENMWNKMHKIHNLIGSICISVDASTKETYEIIRRGGNWNTLMNNLKFISKLDCFIYFVFIVQDTNYKEMKSFYNLIENISPKFKIVFNKISNWGTYTEEEFKNKEIYNESHPEFNLFLIELNKIAFKNNVVETNMNDIIEKHLINKKIL